ETKLARNAAQTSSSSRAAAQCTEHLPEQASPFLGWSLGDRGACTLLKFSFRKLAEVLRGTLVISLIVKAAVVGMSGNEAVMILSGFPIINCPLATKAAHKVINSVRHRFWRVIFFVVC